MRTYVRKIGSREYVSTYTQAALHKAINGVNISILVLYVNVMLQGNK